MSSDHGSRLRELIEQVKKLQTYAMNWQGTEFGGLVEREKVLALLRASASAPHFCARCHHRWEGEGGAEYCGDCHRQWPFQQWRPIETAPKCERVLVLMPRGGLLFGCLVMDENEEYIWTDDETGQSIRPTHWMLLPIAASASAPPEKEWQPIKTAPRDGTQVWAWDDARGSNPALYLRDGDIWVITYDDAEIHPTHWMPLPTPPVTSHSALPEKEFDNEDDQIHTGDDERLDALTDLRAGLEALSDPTP